MTHDCETVFGIKRDRFHCVTVVKRGIEVTRLAIETYCDDVLVVTEQVDAGLACIHLLHFAVDCYGDGLFCHEVSFAIGARGTKVQAWTVCYLVYGKCGTRHCS